MKLTLNTMQSFLTNIYRFICDLHLSNDDFVFQGVCGGLGESTKIPSWIFRLLFLVGVLVFGFGILLYVAMAFLFPERRSRKKTEKAIKYLEELGFEITLKQANDGSTSH